MGLGPSLKHPDCLFVITNQNKFPTGDLVAENLEFEFFSSDSYDAVSDQGALPGTFFFKSEVSIFNFFIIPMYFNMPQD